MCYFCHREDETIEHIHVLWECNHVQSFLDEFKYYVKKNKIKLELSEKLFILGFPDRSQSVQRKKSNTLVKIF